MPKAHQPHRGSPAGSEAARRPRLLCATVSSLTLAAVVITTAWGSPDRLGAPTYWPWLLTGLQVLALWAAGTHRWWGWLMGAAVQPPWIAYAVVTTQLGFIPGCAVSAAVQTYSFLAARAPSASRQDVELYA